MVMIDCRISVGLCTISFDPLHFDILQAIMTNRKFFYLGRQNRLSHMLVLTQELSVLNRMTESLTESLTHLVIHSPTHSLDRSITR